MTRTTPGILVLGLVVLGAACRSDSAEQRSPSMEERLAAQARFEIATLELVETAPVETTLDHPDLREAWIVWQEMIDGAEHTIDLLQFYASNEPGSRLEPVLAALERAAARGVRIRFVADLGFHDTYPQTLDWLDAHEGIEVRLYDLRTKTGGVQHAKALIVDERDVFLGSQNFDWRSLEHIQELGVRIGSRSLARFYVDVFEFDWQWANAPERADPPAVSARTTEEDWPLVARLVGEPETVLIWPAASPAGLLPHSVDPPPVDQDATEHGWELPRLVAWIDAAEDEVLVQLLSYKTVGRDRTYFFELENALRSAAARGVRVRLLVADWSKRRGTVEGLVSLAALPGVDVRFATIPEASTGFVPFARVIHAKFLCIDGRRAWIGTSNWERSYFTQSRNLGLFVEGAPFARRLVAFFTDVWDSPYAEDVVPGRVFTAPRIGE